MWYLFLIFAGGYALHRVLEFIPTNGIELAVNQFLLLGIIPGTNISITFNWFIVAFWLIFFYWLLTKVTFAQLQKYRMFKKMNHINQISL